MTKEDKTKLYIGRQESTGKEVHFEVSDLHKSELDKIPEELNLPSRAAAIRTLVEIGRHTIAENDPRNLESQESADQSPTIRSYVPEGKNNAIPIREDSEETLLDRIEHDLLDAVIDDPELEKDGWKVYKKS